ncbi:hypothetical protein [uncultured Halomonas sp.]|uniref:hypothetical protein n=1 Tax=uncultured Halomonas sp. TaxID=173971 RepID=UPI00261FC67C|nr:hypothetical protein [uncultured Halomonas sp.]
MKIEKNIPIPEHEIGRKSGNEQTSWAMFSEMEVGDSVLVDGDSTARKDCPAMNSANVYGYTHGKRFSGRKQGNGKVRIWRIE